MSITLKNISSLEKVFSDEALNAPDFTFASAAQGEVFSFQTAVYCDMENNIRDSKMLKLESSSELPVQIRMVASTPVSMPQFLDDENQLRSTPGLYPDLLDELKLGKYMRLPVGQWHAAWITVRVPRDCAPDKYPVKISVSNVGPDFKPLENGGCAEALFELEVLPFALPEAKLLRYEWFHCDCLATCYKTPVWSEKHWEIVENFVRNGMAHDMNVLMTPLWTLPLDTAVGGERPTAQLLKIRKDGDRYSFDFSLLERFVKIGLKYGVKRFAMSHAFTQWGAKATPKIIAGVDGVEKRIFGWDVPANSPEYADFLTQLMPPLFDKFRELGIEDKIFFSVSDEPIEEHLESYGYASKLLKNKIGNAPTLDALSSFAFYQHGLVERPVVSNNHIEPFVGKVEEMWTYYCCAQYKKVPNRFLSQPSARNRIMGLMLYLYKAVGFLQWGFNFYYSQYSRYEVDPFRDSCAGDWVPGGDPYIVYPGADGNALDSLRHEVFFDGLQDLRALQALEGKIGREAVVAMIQEGVDYTIDMQNYPWSAKWLLDLRERINRKLAE